MYKYICMKTVLKVKLLTTKESHSALWRTMEDFNSVCNQLSKQAFDSKIYNKIKIQDAFYQWHRETMPKFSSQLLIRAMDVTAQSYKTKRHKKPNSFSQTSAVVYDARCLTLKDNSVSIWTSSGRLTIPIQVYNTELFKFRKGQVDLVLQNKKFYLLVTLEIPEAPQYDAEGVIGVDLGVKNIAVDSTGKIFSSDIIENKRKKYHSYRQRLQKRGTRSAKRRLKSFGKKESRFRKDINHQISKYLVSKAKGTQSAIALEELSHINDRVTVRKQNRNERMSWSFAQLRQFITYKCQLLGVSLLIVDPAYTSRTCNICGFCSKENRKNQAIFHCVSCGHADNADYNASKNIQKLGLDILNTNRVAVNLPIAPATQWL